MWKKTEVEEREKLFEKNLRAAKETEVEYFTNEIKEILKKI